jgi:ATP-binding cassette, subfamily B, bacterial
MEKNWRTSLRETWSYLPRTARLVWRESRSSTFAIGAFTLVSAALPLAVGYAGKRIIDAVLAHDRDLALRFTVLELGLVALSALAVRMSGLARTLLGARLGARINVMILEKAQSLTLGQFEDPNVYDQLSRARREASSRPLSVITTAFALLQNVLLLLGTMGLLLQLSPLSVLALILAALPATFAELRFSTAAFRMRNFRAPETRRLNYIEFLLGNEGNAKEMMTFGLGPTFLERYRTLAESITLEDAALAKKRAVYGYLLSLLALLAFYGFYGTVAVRAAQGLITVGNLTLYVLMFRQGQGSFQSLLSGMSSIFEDNLYMSNLFAFLDLQLPQDKEVSALPANVTTPVRLSSREEPNAPPSRNDASEPHDDNEKGIVFENVGFRYPGKDAWALRHIRVHVKPGERIALVGENGSGKTTFIKLLTRLYEPTEGHIRLDGKLLRDYDPVELRKVLGVIFQDFVRYQLSLRENVGVGDIARSLETQRVEEALVRGGADDLPKTLPEGLETALGRWFTVKGTELSGGQWQRIALARAFMRTDAKILVLDEPTSALDAESEEAIFQRFQALSEGKTTFLISHRFPTVRTAHRILVLRQGEIVEEGSHAELLARGGRYSELFALQAKGYL